MSLIIDVNNSFNCEGKSSLECRWTVAKINDCVYALRKMKFYSRKHSKSVGTLIQLINWIF